MELSSRAASFFNHFWLWRLSNSPEFATSIGCHTYDNRLDEMSLNSYLRREDEAKVILEELLTIKSLTSIETDLVLLINLELLKVDLEQYLSGMTYCSYVWPLNQLEGPQSDFPRLLSYMKRESLSDLKKIINRMRKFPQQIDETVQLLKEGVRIGMTMHSLSVNPVIKTLETMLKVPIKSSSFYQLFNECPLGISFNDWEDLVNEAENVIELDVYPSYTKLLSYLIEFYLPQTRLNVSISSVKNGSKLYEACLKFHTSTDKSPHDIHAIGVQEVDRITQRMIDVKNMLGFEGTLEDFQHYLKEDAKFSFSSADEMMQYYEGICKEIKNILPNYFTKLPKAKYIITEMNDHVAPTMPNAYYLAPSEDSSRPGTFFVNTSKLEMKRKFEALSLALHEAEPGHHLQSALTMEYGPLVEFRRFLEDRKYYESPARFSLNTAYVEGWGLYSEYLGEEMGLYKDLYDLYGRLSNEMLRACRLVVDTGIHALGWSKDKAIEYMSKHTATDSHTISSEIDRYITWPGQACGYKMGEIKIKELRGLSTEKLGEKFDLKQFHDLVASMGGMPLNILEKQIEIYIKNKLK